MYIFFKQIEDKHFQLTFLVQFTKKMHQDNLGCSDLEKKDKMQPFLFFFWWHLNN